MLPSVRGICTGATGKKQANHTCFESCFYGCIQSEHGTKSWGVVTLPTPNTEELPYSVCWLGCSIIIQDDGIFWISNSNWSCRHQVVCTWNVCAPLYISPHLMVTFTSTGHILSNIYILHFLCCHIFGKKSLPWLTEWPSYMYSFIYTTVILIISCLLSSEAAILPSLAADLCINARSALVCIVSFVQYDSVPKGPRLSAVKPLFVHECWSDVVASYLNLCDTASLIIKCWKCQPWYLHSWM